MIDTHAHLDFPEFEKDREEVIARAFDNGIKAIVNVGVDLERSKKSVELAERHSGVFVAVGFHPDYFVNRGNQGDRENWKGALEELKKLAKHKKVVAIGETGLDYYHVTRNPAAVPRSGTLRGKHETIKEIKKRQKEGFLAQIEIARELGLPVIVHCREVYPVASPQGERFGAWEDLHKIISNLKFKILKFVLHCYSGERKDTKKFLELPNIYFSFSGNITYPKPVDRAEKLAEAVRMIPLDKIMLDSDAPFLAPQEMRGKRNEPIFINYIAKKIAEIKEIGEKEVERKTDENAVKFFSLG